MEPQLKQLGNSSLRVSPVAIGCWQFAGGKQWGDQDERDSQASVTEALDQGINFFDTAPMYGNGSSEEVLGRALKGRRDQAVIATKVNASDLARIDLKTSCEASLKRLNTDVIDLLQVHWGNPDIPLEDTVAGFEDLVEAGKIRAYGVCNFAVAGMRAAEAAGARLATQQLPYSLLWRAIEFEIVDECDRQGVSVLPYSPLLQGLLAGKFRSVEEIPSPRKRTRHFSSAHPDTVHGEAGQEEETFAAVQRIEGICRELGQPMAQVAIAWLLRQRRVASVIAGARTPGQVRDNAAAGRLRIPDEVESALSEATIPLRDALGSNPDMWQTPSRFV